MESPARVDLGADRWVTFVRVLTFVGYDFTGAAFAMQVRDRKDGSAVRATLGTVGLIPPQEGVALLYGGTDTVANHIAAARLEEAPAGKEEGDSVELSLLRIQIDKATMVDMPLPSEVGADHDLQWDIHITPSGGIADKYAGGKFTVRAGVVQ